MGIYLLFVCDRRESPGRGSVSILTGRRTRVKHAGEFAANERGRSLDTRLVLQSGKLPLVEPLCYHIRESAWMHAEQFPEVA